MQVTISKAMSSRFCLRLNTRIIQQQRCNFSVIVFRAHLITMSCSQRVTHTICALQSQRKPKATQTPHIASPVHHRCVIRNTNA
jgi:hypothetical protein